MRGRSCSSESEQEVQTGAPARNRPRAPAAAPTSTRFIFIFPPQTLVLCQRRISLGTLSITKAYLVPSAPCPPPALPALPLRSPPPIRPRAALPAHSSRPRLPATTAAITSCPEADTHYFG